MNKPKKTNQNKPGPKPEALKAEGVDWQDAMRHALGKKKPKTWPDEHGQQDDAEEKGQRD